jgi:hypothetical protein
VGDADFAQISDHEVAKGHPSLHPCLPHRSL